MNLDYIMQLEETETVIYIIRLFFINLFTYFLNLKIVNIKVKRNLTERIIIMVLGIFIAIICNFIRKSSNFSYLVISMLIISSVLFSVKYKYNLGYSIIITIFSLAVNYFIFSASTFLAFLIFSIFNIKSDYINLLIILTIYIFLIISLAKIKKFNKGLTFFSKRLNTEYFDLLILNISCVILFCIILLSNYGNEINRSLGIGLIMFVLMMVITIQKSLQLYYKQKMLVKDLEETKTELEEKNNRIKELEKEIIKSGKEVIQYHIGKIY